MKSMTGYGKAVVNIDNKELTIELKSVNNRFLEINSRLPKAFSAIEDIITKAIQRTVKRGSVDVYVTYSDRSESPKLMDVDLSLIGGYIDASQKVLEAFPQVTNDLQLTSILKIPDVMRVASDDNRIESLKTLASACAITAVTELDKMRVFEGRSISQDLQAIINSITLIVNKVTQRAPEVISEYRNKLKTRIVEALEGIDIDESKLINEVAFFFDKSDINEEISRMNAHIAQFVEIMSKDESVGRQLDFLTQEMVRESNTMCSKSNDIVMTNYLVELKNQVEKLKEQIRNVE